MTKQPLVQLFAAGTLIAAALVATTFPAFGSPNHSPTQAQENDLNLSFTFEQADVRQALREVFKKAGVSFTIAPDVQGIVTVDLKNVSFETALQNILRQVDATYRIEGGVYQLVRREPPQPVPGFQVVDGDQDHGVAITEDGKFLYVVKGRTVYELRKSDLHIVAKTSL